MTYLLDQAFAAAKALPEPEQNAIAAAILAEIQDERRWVEAFARSPEAVSELAGEALSAGYAAMAADEAREAEAGEWAEALLGDVSDKAR
jgi:hypothetical protein